MSIPNIFPKPIEPTRQPGSANVHELETISLPEDILRIIFKETEFAPKSRYSIACKASLTYFKDKQKNHLICGSLFRKVLENWDVHIEKTLISLSPESSTQRNYHHEQKKTLEIIAKFFNKMAQIHPQSAFARVNNVSNKQDTKALDVDFAVLKKYFKGHERIVQPIENGDNKPDEVPIEFYIQRILENSELVEKIVNEIPVTILEEIAKSRFIIKSVNALAILQSIHKRCLALIPHPQFPSELSVSSLMKNSYLNSGNLEQALDCINLQILRADEDFIREFELDNILRITRKLTVSKEQELIVKIRKLLDEFKSSQNKSFIISRIYIQIGDCKKAEEILSPYIASKRNNMDLTECLLDLAKKYEVTGNRGQAIKYLEMTLMKNNELLKTPKSQWRQDERQFSIENSRFIRSCLIQLNCLECYFKMNFKDLANGILDNLNTTIAVYMRNSNVTEFIKFDKEDVRKKVHGHKRENVHTHDLRACTFKGYQVSIKAQRYKLLIKWTLLNLEINSNMDMNEKSILSLFDSGALNTLENSTTMLKFIRKHQKSLKLSV